MTKKHKHVFYIFGSKMAHKRIVLMFYFFSLVAKKNGKWMSSTLLLVFSNYSFQQLLIRDISRMYTTSISFFYFKDPEILRFLPLQGRILFFLDHNELMLAGETAAGHVP